MNETIKLIGILSILLLAGCSQAYNRGAVDIDSAKLNAKHNKTDLYLFPGVEQENPTEVMNKTHYQIFRNGDYLGVWESNRWNPANFNLNQTNKSITFLPYDEIEMIVWSDPSKKYPLGTYKKYMEMMVEDKALEYVVPKLKPITQSGFHFHVTDQNFHHLSDQNWTISMLPNDRSEITVDLPGYDNDKFQYFCCNYENLYDFEVDLIQKRDGSRDFTCSGRNYYELDGENKFSFYLYSSPYFEKAQITCHFLDADYFINHHGEIEYGIVDDNWNDLGLPNPSFNITILPKSRGESN